MAESRVYDVFLSHSSLDKNVVVPIAERLRLDGLAVWLDDWEIKPGDSIPALIEVGLEQSRHLVLCMSAQAFGSDWAHLESQTFRFRDPLNRERRFIPLRLDDAPIKGSLAQFKYIDWRVQYQDSEYQKLLDACRKDSTPPPTSEHQCQNVADLQRLIRVAGVKKREWERLKAEFELEASKYHELKFKVYEGVAGSGRPITGEDLPKPHHTINLWQFVGYYEAESIQEWVRTTKGTDYGLTGAGLSIFGAIIGDQTAIFLKMAIRAASLLSKDSTNLLGEAIVKSFSVEPDKGKPIFTINNNGLAKWLNLILVATALIHPDRLQNGELSVDPFAASITIFDYLSDGN